MISEWVAGAAGWFVSRDVLVPHASIEEFFYRFIEDLGNYSQSGDYFAMMIDWRVLVLMGIVVAAGAFLKSKGIVITVFALYAVTATIHFALGPSGAGASGQTLNQLDNIVILVVGVLAVGVTIIYFVFIKSD